MPAPKQFRPVCITPLKTRSKKAVAGDSSGYPWLVVTVKDRLTREAYKVNAPDIEAYVDQAAQERGLAEVLHYPWWYRDLPKDQHRAPKTEAQLLTLERARQRKAEIQRESMEPYDPQAMERALA